MCDDAGVDSSILVSVLIPAYNEEQFIAGSLDSVRRSFSGIRQSSYEIVVCDNNSTVGTAEIARAAGISLAATNSDISDGPYTCANLNGARWLSCGN